MWYRPVAKAPIQSLACERPYASGVALKRPKKNNKKSPLTNGRRLYFAGPPHEGSSSSEAQVSLSCTRTPFIRQGCYSFFSSALSGKGVPGLRLRFREGGAAGPPRPSLGFVTVTPPLFRAKSSVTPALLPGTHQACFEMDSSLVFTSLPGALKRAVPGFAGPRGRPGTRLPSLTDLRASRPPLGNPQPGFKCLSDRLPPCLALGPGSRVRPLGITKRSLKLCSLF